AVVVALVHASGGLSNGLGGLLVVSIGALGLLVPPRLAFLFAAVASLALLAERGYSHLSGEAATDQYVAVALLGILRFPGIAVVVALVHASGGLSNGLGGLLVVSIGALGLLVPPRLAFLFAAVASLALLAERGYSHLSGEAATDQYVAVALLGIVLFLISAVV